MAQLNEVQRWTDLIEAEQRCLENTDKTRYPDAWRRHYYRLEAMKLAEHQLTAAQSRVAELTAQCDDKETRLLAAARKIADLEHQASHLDQLNKLQHDRIKLLEDKFHRKAKTVNKFAELGASLTAENAKLKQRNSDLIGEIQNILGSCCEDDPRLDYVYVQLSRLELEDLRKVLDHD